VANQEPVETSVSLPLVLLGAEEQTFEHANVFILTVTPDGAHLTAGQVQPPLLLGSPEEQRGQADKLSYVGVKVLAKLVMTPQRLLELRNLINGQLEQLGM
jgi:hypothetical protein